MAVYTSQEYYDMLMTLGEYTPNCTQIEDIYRVTLYLQQLKGFTILAMSCRTNTTLEEITILEMYGTRRESYRGKSESHATLKFSNTLEN
ncbi:hypothetical protein ACFW04_012228 [Cataglyphis niger]